MIADGGPIDRIYRKIVPAQDGIVSDETAEFCEEDFVMDPNFVDRMRDAGADRKAVECADKLIPSLRAK